MFEKYIRQEIRSLESITQKGDLMDFYHKSRRCLSSTKKYYTQFDFESDNGFINDLLLTLVRDYALFDENNLDIFSGDDFRG